MRNSLLYAEHTWGAHSSITQPESQFVQDQWAIKAGFAEDAHAEASTLVADGLTGLAAAVKGAQLDALLVYNPLSWERSDVVLVPAGDRPFRLVDLAAGGSPPQEVVVEGDARFVAFHAQAIPPMGYKCYTMQPREAWPAPAARVFRDDRTAVDTGRYEVRIVPRRGGITRITDNETGRELVDRDSAYGLGEWIYELHATQPWGGPVQERTEARGAGVTTTEGARVLGSATMDVELPALGRATLKMTWSPFSPAIGVEVTTDKRQTYDPESIFVAFPFAVPDGRIRYELADAVAEVNADQLPNGCRDWYSVQHFADISNEEFGVTWATRDAFLAEFCQTWNGQWLPELPVTNATVFANVMGNLWFTNYKAAQSGEHRFRFAILPHEGPFDRAESVRFGFEVANPLQTAVVRARQPGALATDSASFVRTSQRDVAVLTVKRPESGSGLIVRLYEMSGEAQDCWIEVPEPLAKAELCNLVEEPLEELTVQGRRCRVPLAGGGLATVRVTMGSAATAVEQDVQDEGG